MLGVFERAGYELTRELAGGVVEVQFPIASTERFELSVEERDHTAVVASLRSFFEPTSVAVVGASPRRGTIGGELFRNVLEGDFTGAAYPVNPKGAAVAGVRGYASVAEIPDPVDLAVIAVPGEHVLAAAEDALRHGVRALVVISAGFAEVGSEGAERQEQLLALVRAHGARLIGPNCLGIAVAGPRLNATFAARSAPSGNIGFSSQSGALGLALLEAADARGLGLSAFVSIGNKADVSSNDLLEWWEEDEATEVVLLYVESFGNPRRFGRLARRVARRKPILALKSGTSATGQRAASSHTAALAGSEAGVDALFHQAGVTRAASLEELIDVATLLSSQPEPKGRRVAVLTNAGGLGILAADACDAAGLELPTLGEETVSRLRELLPAEASVANPVDMLGSATASSYGEALPIVLDDPHVDAVLVLFVPAVTATADEVAVAVDAAARSRPREQAGARCRHELGRRSRGPSFRLGRRRVRLPGVGGARARPRRGARGVAPTAARLGSDARRHRPRRCRCASSSARSRRAEDSWLDPAETRELLDAYGLPLVPERVAVDAEAAVAGGRRAGLSRPWSSRPPPAPTRPRPAASRSTSRTRRPFARRQSGSGSRSSCSRCSAAGPNCSPGFCRIRSSARSSRSGPAASTPSSSAKRASGSRRSPTSTRRSSSPAGKAGRLVRGFRGAEPADAAALVDLVHRLAALGDDLPAVAELDLNPVLGFPDRARRSRRPRSHPPAARAAAREELVARSSPQAQSGATPMSRAPLLAILSLYRSTDRQEGADEDRDVSSPNQEAPRRRRDARGRLRLRARGTAVRGRGHDGTRARPLRRGRQRQRRRRSSLGDRLGPRPRRGSPRPRSGRSERRRFGRYAGRHGHARRNARACGPADDRAQHNASDRHRPGAAATARRPLDARHRSQPLEENSA